MEYFILISFEYIFEGSICSALYHNAQYFLKNISTNQMVMRRNRKAIHLFLFKNAITQLIKRLFPPNIVAFVTDQSSSTMTQQRLIDYRNKEENSRCILSDASLLSRLSLFPFGYPTLSPDLIPGPYCRRYYCTNGGQSSTSTHRLELQCDRRNP